MAERIPTPPEIRRKMDLWRMGLECFPREYIAWNRKLAAEALKDLIKQGLKVAECKMASDGWGDGMRSLHVTGIMNNRIVKLYWNDGSQCFFIQSKSGGSWTFRPEEVVECV